MAGRVIYLDVDDEITSAAARIRAVEGALVAVVLPHGSRIATSRINFRLLARDAQGSGKQLAVVAGDAATRALAASAGLPTFATISEYEAADADDDAPEAIDQAEAADAIGLAASSTVVSPVPVSPPAPPPAARRTPSVVPADRVVRDSTPPDPVREPPPPRSRAGRDDDRPRAGGVPTAVALAVLALAVLVGGVGAYLLLPSATAVVTARESTVGPIALRVVASTAAQQPDPEALVVPAITKTIDLEAGQRFPVTGKRVEEAFATGTVRFRNFDFTRSESVPKDSVVSTQGGIRFTTDKAVTVPRAERVFTQIFPASATVTVTAVQAGPEGNVEPNTILIIPRGEDPLTLDVTNPDATTGGTRDEFPRITQEDVDAAVATLTIDLQTALEDRLDDPDLAEDGTTVFPETAELGAPDYSVELASLVGQEVDGFDLTATASATALAVDEAAVLTVAEANIISSVDPGNALVEGSSEVDPAPAVIANGVVTFPVVVTARQVLDIDPAAIKAEILGRSLDDARAILRRYGEVELTVWPDWVATIPTIDLRVDVRAATPITVETPGPSPAASP